MRGLAPRLALIAVIAVACKGGGGTTTPGTGSGAPAPIAPQYPAARWAPPSSTYTIAARTVREAQVGVRHAIDALGVIGGVGIEEASTAARGVLQLDVFSPDAVRAIGIDLDGGFLLFSEDINPTIVVHLSAPEQTTGFFEQLRERGLVTQSVIVDDTEIFTAKLDGDVSVSWAIANDWMWTHFSFDFAREKGTAWFRAKAAPATAGSPFATRWAWAAQAGASIGNQREPGVVGFADFAKLVARITEKASGGREMKAAAACAKLVSPVQGLALAIEGDGAQVAGRIAIDVGDTAGAVQRHALPVPAGWDGAAAKSALGFQWNLDVAAIAEWIGPCARSVGELGSLERVKQLGVRGARAFLEELDLDAKSGRGVVSLDLTSSRYFERMLDEIPLRSTLERDRTFGALQGHSISVPFGPTIDYVLTTKVGYAAMGDGLLAQAIGAGAPVTSALARIDIAPQRLPAATWKQLLNLVGFEYRADAMVVRMNRWQEGHIGLAIDGTSIVLDARGIRR